MDWNAINVILGVLSMMQTAAIVYIGSKAAKIDKLQDQLEQKQAETIDSRMELLEARLQVSTKSLEHIVATMQQRLESGDQHFKSVDQKCHAIELKVMQQVTELYRGLATKEDLKEFAGVMNGMQRTIAQLQAKLDRVHEPIRN